MLDRRADLCQGYIGELLRHRIESCPRTALCNLLVTKTNFTLQYLVCSDNRSHQLATSVSQLANTPPSLPINLLFNSALPHTLDLAAGPALQLQLLLLLSTPRHSRTPCLTSRRSYAKRRMPPKKQVKEEKVLLGRPGNNLKSGIVCGPKRWKHPNKD